MSGQVRASHLLVKHQGSRKSAPPLHCAQPLRRHHTHPHSIHTPSTLRPTVLLSSTPPKPSCIVCCTHPRCCPSLSLTSAHLSPTSWKDPEGKVIRARTKEQAIAQLTALRQQVVDGKADLATLAARESDCSSAKAGGDLGRFGRGSMQKPFEDATYALKVGELSGVVDTASGVHIIKRTE